MIGAMQWLHQGRRFATVGIANTLFGYAVIVAALTLGASDYLANALGYGVGLAIGFLLHRDWSFAGRGELAVGAPRRYLVAFAAAYAVNLTLVALARRLGMIDMPATHIVAMAAYSVTFFVLARHYVFVAQPAGIALANGSGHWLTRHLASVSIMLGGAAYAALVYASPTTHDVVWQLWIGERLHQGSRLYVDIMEINPPLWFWMAQTAAAVGDLLSVEPRTILIAAIALWTMTAAWLLSRLVAELPGRRLFVGFFLAAVAAYSLLYFGQREHLALLAALPYAALIARRRSGAAVAPGLAIGIAVLASAGFALKHYFIAVPLLLETWLAVGAFAAGRYAWLRAETIMLGVCATIYAVAVVALTPEFLSAIVPMVELAYDSYEVTWRVALVRPQLIFTLLAGVAAIGLMRSDKAGGAAVAPMLRELVAALLLASTGFAVAFVVQKKGWPYHGLPMTLAAFMGLAAALFLHDAPAARLRHHPLAAALLCFLLYSAVTAGGYTNPIRSSVERMIRDVPAHEPVAALGSDPMIAWPMLAERHHPWIQRHYALWMLKAVVANEQLAAPDPQLVALGQRIRRETVIDLACRPPRMMLIDDAAARLELPVGSFDLLAWLQRDRAFALFFERYRFVSAGDFGVRAFVTDGPLTRRRLADCRQLG